LNSRLPKADIFYYLYTWNVLSIGKGVFQSFQVEMRFGTITLVKHRNYLLE
jgi:hypothetical protein